MVNKITNDFLVTMLTLVTKVTNAPMGTFASTVTMVTSGYCLPSLCKYAISVLHCGYFISLFIISNMSDRISMTPFKKSQLCNRDVRSSVTQHDSCNGEL